MSNSSYVVICPDGVQRHSGRLSYGGALAFADTGHACMAAHYHRLQVVTEQVEAGNLHIGDTVLLPGDIEATVEDLDWIPATKPGQAQDAMSIVFSTGRSFDCRFSTVFNLIERA